MPKTINATVLWSDSKTKDSLTTYAEGLACRNFDLRVNYHHRCTGELTWDVMFKNDQVDYECNPCTPLKFVRVRVVTIDGEGFMSCSCGYVQQMLMPCRHIAAVLKDKENYLPSLFHVRWNKIYNYYHNQQSLAEICPNVSMAIKNLDIFFKTKSFKESGKWKGVYVANTNFSSIYINSYPQETRHYC